MRLVRMKVLRDAARELRVRMRQFDPEEAGTLIKGFGLYEGFEKSRIPRCYLEEIKALRSVIDLNNIQAELVRVPSGSKTDKPHYHKKSDAYVICLGYQDRMPDPCHALRYYCRVGGHDHWLPFAVNEEIAIPRGSHHGFCIKPGGTLYFLSVQSPPISSEHHNDFHIV